jgi:CDP-paratose 2-epimerase
VKYLVTGGCGFVGSNLASEVLRRGAELAVLDNLSRKGSEKNLAWLQSQGEFAHHRLDMRISNDVEKAVREEKPDVVFHLAGQVAMTTSIENPRLDFEVNALGTHNLLEAVRRYRPEAIILYSSTNKVYGDLGRYTYIETSTRYQCKEFPRGFDESVPLDFHSPYGCSKGAADQFLLDYHRTFGTRTVVFRHSSMYGGHQYATYDQGWIGWFCQVALEIQAGTRKEPFTISGNGKQVRDILFAGDIVDLYFRAVEQIEQAQGKAFNIGGGMQNSLSLLELFSMLEELLDVRMTYTRLPWRASDQKVFVADTASAERDIRWTPLTSAREGIQSTLAWLKANS